MPSITEAEVTITKIWPPKGKYFAFNCAELATDTNKYGRVSAPLAFLKKFKENNVYRIAYHETEEGYLNLDTIITDTGKTEAPPQRPATNQKDSDRMGTMGMVNAILSGVCHQAAVSDVLDLLGKGTLAKIIDLCNSELHRSKMHGGEVQTRADMDDQIGF